MNKQTLANWLSGPITNKELDVLVLEMDMVMRQPETCSALGTLRELEFRKHDHDGDTALPMSYTREDGTIQDNEVAFMYPNRVALVPIRNY
ncbi:hypothetical protein pVa21_051 [Vibrio phage pVa-21]|nr:hypothetical protein pVa21_051 [Vibrio phage pVa-21]